MGSTVSAKWVKYVARPLVITAMSGALMACSLNSLNPFTPKDQPKAVPLTDRIGAVAADEPLAATVGADVLRGGGNAADAAIAMYFAMAVTYPMGGGLGGGGTCLYRDRPSGTMTTIEFMPGASDQGGLTETPVPGAVAGMGALHALAGATPWAELLAPAEVMARSGYNASRARVRATAALPPAYRGKSDLAALTRSAKGAKIAEGSRMQDTALADTLLSIRSRGAGEFYAGKLAERFVNAARREGMRLSMADMQGYQPVIIGAESYESRVGDFIVPSATSSARRILLAVLQYPEFRRRADDMSPAGRAEFARAIEAQARKELGFGAIPEDALTGGGSFVVTDRIGNTAACSFTTYGALGSGVMAGDLGFTFAGAIASPAGVAARLGLMPVLIDASGVDVGAAVAGGPGSVAMLAALYADSVMDTEESFRASVRQAAHKRGRAMNAIACTGGSSTARSASGILYNTLGLKVLRGSGRAQCVPETASGGFGLAQNVYPE